MISIRLSIVTASTLLAFGAVPGCIEFAPGPFFEVIVPPSDDPDGAYRVPADGNFAIPFQIRMGDNVRGEDFSVSVTGEPDGILDFGASNIGALGPNETRDATYEFLSLSQAPGQFTVSIRVSADIFDVNNEGGDFTDSVNATFTMIVEAPNAERHPTIPWT